MKNTVSNKTNRQRSHRKGATSAESVMVTATLVLICSGLTTLGQRAVSKVVDVIFLTVGSPWL